MIKELEILEKTIKDIQPKVKEFIQNKDNSLEERWEVFLNAGIMGVIPSDTCYFKPEGINWEEGSLFDTFYTSKYQNYNPCMLEKMALEENLFLKDDKNHNLFKESYMEKFIFTVINNW